MTIINYIWAWRILNRAGLPNSKLLNHYTVDWLSGMAQVSNVVYVSISD
jgi:hypothetical protein